MRKRTPYSLVFDADGNYLICDAAANAIIKYEVATGTFSVLVTFPNFMNPTPVGPPFVNVVPTKILAHPEGGYLVASLTGFPFLDGASSIYRVMDDGSTSVFASGLTLVTDMDFDPNDDKLVAMQFAQFGPVDTTFGFIFNSAQLIKIHQDGTLDTTAAGFGPAPGLAISANGTAYMTHLFLGQLLQTDAISGMFDFQLPSVNPMTAFPNPSNGRFSAKLFLGKPGEASYRLTDLLGRQLATGQLGYLPAGQNQLTLDFSNDNIRHGAYTLSIKTESGYFVSKVVFN